MSAVLKSLHSRARVFSSFALAVLTFLVASLQLKVMTCLVLAWSVGTLFWLFLVLLGMLTASPEETLQRAQLGESRPILILTATVTTSIASLIAMAFMLANTQNWPPLDASLHLTLSLIAVFASWFFLHVTFALHYARLYYDPVGTPAEGQYAKGMQYPTSDPPDYWDFLYFSFTIAMCAQTSDVSVTTSSMRRLVLVHSIAAFLFYTVILGLVLNGVSTLI